MKVLVEAYGCTLNQGEGRHMATMLLCAGHAIVDRAEEAEGYLLVTCTVIGATEAHMVKRMGELADLGGKLVVAGCMASVQADRIHAQVPGAGIVGPREGDRVLDYFPPEVPEVSPVGCAPPDGPVEGIVPIAQGCLANCTYCLSKVARGNLQSYSMEAIEAEVRSLVGSGVREVRLTSLDTAQWGLDRGQDLPMLLRRVTALDGPFRVRVGMMNPLVARFHFDDLMEAYAHPKVYRFLHLPVQSGDDAILMAMRRGYRAEHWKALAEAYRRRFPTGALATDVIVGFPGETQEAFEATMDLMEETRPDIINITRFSPRPGTAAATMAEQPVGWRVKEWSRRLTAQRFRIGLENNQGLVGRTFPAVAMEHLKPGTTVLRTDDYRPVVVAEEVPLGWTGDVVVDEARSVYLVGRVQR